jgi:hypothetical protein
LLSDNDITNSGVANSIGVNDQICAPVDLQGNTFTGVGIDVDPAACVVNVTGTGVGTGTGGNVPVLEPGSLALLLSALVGCVAIRARATAGA